MELKEGMYVRTEKGKIDKIIGFDGALILFLYDLAYGYIDENDIIKASNNIIDLIEVGDYVNGFPVRFAFNCDEDSTGLFIDTNSERVFLDKPSQVKSIVTKEQFESMQYKVEE